MSEPRSQPLDWETLRRLDRQVFWHPFTQMAEYEPLIFTHAQGCWLFDHQGRRYLDGISSLWCNIHGHRHPKIDQAVREQLERAAHTTALGASHPVGIRLAARLVELAPSGLEHVFFSDNGATAVEVALKMAFQFWRQCSPPQPQRTLYLAFGQAYHGDTLGSVSVGGVELFHGMFEPLLFRVVRAPVPDGYRLPPGISPQHACQFYVEQFRRLLEKYHQQLVAVVMEPLVQAAAGMIMHPPGFLRQVAQLCRQYDVLLILDEVAVGMGRTGTLFACEQEGVCPDFLCLAKGLTGGYLPLAATLTTHRVWEAFLGSYAQRRQFFHGHTYCGNPLGAAAALATLEVFEEEKTLEHLPAKAQRLQAHLDRIAQLPWVGDVRRRGLIAAVELVRNRATKEPFPWEQQRGWAVCHQARRRGVFLRPLGNVIVLMPPLAISLDEIDLLGQVVYESIQACFAQENCPAH